jgi:hypothetical protein
LSVSATETAPHTLDLTSPFFIGDVEIASVIIAPMAGVSVQAFRRQGSGSARVSCAPRWCRRAG